MDSVKRAVQPGLEIARQTAIWLERDGVDITNYSSLFE